MILTNALLITPAATAALLSDRMPWRMLLGAVLATGCSIAGLALSYVAQTSSGAAIVLSCTAAFIAAYAARSAWHRLRPATVAPVKQAELSEVAPSAEVSQCN